MTEAGRRVVRSRDTSRAEQRSRAPSAGFARADFETMVAAAALIERPGERI